MRYIVKYLRLTVRHYRCRPIVNHLLFIFNHSCNREGYKRLFLYTCRAVVLTSGMGPRHMYRINLVQCSSENFIVTVVGLHAITPKNSISLDENGDSLVA